MNQDRPWWVLVGGRRRLGRHLAEALASTHNLVLTSGEPWDGEEPWVKDLAASTQVRTLCWNAHDPRLVPTMMADSVDLRANGLQLRSVVLLAGAFPEQPFGTWTEADLEALWRLNLSFPLLAVQALASALAPGACVQLLLDTCVHRPFVKRLPYSASKAALAHLVAGLACALAPEVRVVGHALGTVLPAEGSDVARLAERTLLKSLGSPKGLVDALLYAEKSDHLTGDILTLDGGARWS